MRQMMVLVKTNMKLLLRNKGFLFFLFVLPIISLALLNIKDSELKKYGETSMQMINELPSADTNVVYVADMAYYTVKVYDSSQSKLTDYALNQLIDTGMISVCRYRSEDMNENEILSKAKENASYDRIGSILYFTPDFETNILSGNPDSSLQVFQVSDDSRQELLKTSLFDIISNLISKAEYADGDSDKLLDILKTTDENFLTKNVVQINNYDTQSLTSAELTYKEHIGYSLAMISLSFLFCGIFIAHNVIEELENRVYTRITLTYANERIYILSNLAMTVLISVLQTLIVGIGIYLFIKPEFGIPYTSYLLLIFFLGLIFNTLSLCIGVLLGNAMAANYAVFCIWSVSCLLSGLYFSSVHSSGVINKLSNLMPQKWILKSAEMLMLGDKTAYGMATGITVSYLIVILCMGAAGLKLKREV